MNISEQKFEEWRKEQIGSLIRMGYTDAAKAFRDLGSVQWAGWQAAWKQSRESLVIELPQVSDYFDSSEYPHTCDTLERDLRLSIEAYGLKVKP